jgi:hypothetical protein
MTAASPPPPPAPAPASPKPKAEPNEITIVSHSNLFYWWPVWAVGFLAAAITAWPETYMAVVPKGSEIVTDAKEVTIKTEIKTEGGGLKTAEETLPKDTTVMKLPGGKAKLPADPSGVVEQPKLHVSHYRGLGVLFVFTLLLVILITNVPLRGMWSVMIILTLVLLTIIFILLGWWEYILNALYYLDVRINMGGYLVISISLFVIWLLVILFFDRQRYITFTPGQLKVCDEIGGGEQVYDAVGISLQKQRSDLFRHYILGLGSGDLIVKTAGAQSHHFDLPNVLFISQKVHQIEELLKKKAVVETH